MSSVKRDLVAARNELTSAISHDEPTVRITAYLYTLSNLYSGIKSVYKNFFSFLFLNFKLYFFVCTGVNSRGG